MPESLFDTIMKESGVPAFQAVFGIPVLHTNADGDEVTITAMLDTEVAPVGEYGERMESRWTAEVAKSAGVQVGDTLTHAGETTEDDPYPDDVVWTLAQVIADDGYTVRFAVRQQA